MRDHEQKIARALLNLAGQAVDKKLMPRKHLPKNVQIVAEVGGVICPFTLYEVFNGFPRSRTSFASIDKLELSKGAPLFKLIIEEIRA